MVDNCCPCNSWQFFLFKLLYFRWVMFLQAKSTAFYYAVSMTHYGIHGKDHIQSLGNITSYSSIWRLLCTHINQTLAHQNASVNHPIYVLNASSILTTFYSNATNFIHVQLSTELYLPQVARYSTMCHTIELTSYWTPLWRKSSPTLMYSILK